MEPRLIECAMIFVKVELGCVLITYHIPKEIAPDVIQAITLQTSWQYFAENGITKLYVENVCYYGEEHSSPVCGSMGDSSIPVLCRNAVLAKPKESELI